MKEITKDNSIEPDSSLEYIFNVIRENEEFLCQNAKETYEEVVKLINDAIDNIGLDVGKSESKENYVKRSMIFYHHHILMPFSYAIHMDALAGNIPACFMELRLMLESLAKCYLADLKYSEQSFFQERLTLLEKENLSISKHMKELGKQLGLKNRFLALWGKLSNDWIHTKGVMDKVVDQINEKSELPPWALVLPMNYTKNDLDALNELGKRISQFRSLLKTTMEKYREDCGFWV